MFGQMRIGTLTCSQAVALEEPQLTGDLIGRSYSCSVRMFTSEAGTVTGF